MDDRWHLTGSAPRYRQIVSYIETQILSGEMSPGSLLPTERKLAALLQVNRSTVSVAYDELRAKGVIRSIQGSGTRVSEDAWGLDMRAPDWTGYLSQGIFQPTLPLLRHIWEENRKSKNINLARGEMFSELWPVKSWSLGGQLLTNRARLWGSSR